MDDKLLYCGLSLLSACSWAAGAILWRKLGEQISSYSMNLGKVLIGSLYLGIALIFVGVAQIDQRSLMFLVLSGIIGIAVGDTFFFLSLMQLGPRRASLMGSLNPAAIAVAAALVLGERPTAGVWLGIMLTSVGVGFVLWERSLSAGTDKESSSLGIRYGLLSVICTASAVLLAKVGVLSVPTVQAAWIRLLAGSAGLIAWGRCTSRLGQWLEPFSRIALLFKVGVVVTVVVFGGFWLSILSLKHIDAAVAGTLNSTSPLFMLPLSMIFMKERLSLRTILGTAVAVGGVALIIFKI